MKRLNTRSWLLCVPLAAVVSGCAGASSTRESKGASPLAPLVKAIKGPDPISIEGLTMPEKYRLLFASFKTGDRETYKEVKRLLGIEKNFTPASEKFMAGMDKYVDDHPEMTNDIWKPEKARAFVDKHRKPR